MFLYFIQACRIHLMEPHDIILGDTLIIIWVSDSINFVAVWFPQKSEIFSRKYGYVLVWQLRMHGKWDVNDPSIVTAPDARDISI